MYKYPTLAIAILSLLPLSVSSTPSGTALNGKEVKALISGNTVEGHRVKPGKGSQEFMQKSVKFRTYFAADGRVIEKSSASAAGGAAPGLVAAHGNWAVKKGKLCMAFADALDHPNKRVCYKVFSKGGGSYDLYRKGNVNRTWDRVVPGNPHNLE